MFRVISIHFTEHSSGNRNYVSKHTSGSQTLYPLTPEHSSGDLGFDFLNCIQGKEIIIPT